MIAPSVVHEVRRLLAEGRLSQRKIAKIAGVSRGTVGTIAAGRRPDYESLRRNRRDQLPELLGPLQRCPGCGGMAYMPCRACHTRSVAARSPKPRIVHVLMQLDQPLGLDLTEEHQKRYEEVRAAAMARERAARQAVDDVPPCDAADAWDEWDEPDPEKTDLWDPWNEWDEPAIDGEPIVSACGGGFISDLTREETR